MQLSRETITATAVAILDRWGLGDMTMRRIARQLEVAPGALYWHISNKQELITAVGATILGMDGSTHFTSDTVTRFGEDTEPVDELCRKLRAAMLTHRDGADVVATALTGQPLSEALHTSLALAPLSATESSLCGATGARILIAYTVGVTLTDQAVRQQAAGAENHPPDVSTVKKQEQQFNEGLAVIIAGLVAGPMW